MRTFVIIVVSVVLSLAVGSLIFDQKQAGVPGAQETVYERVMRTGKLRCGYLPSATYVDIDPNTGEKSGILVDYMNQLTTNLGLTLEWAEEIGRGDYIAALQSNRFDAYCTAITINAERAREVDFTNPYIYDQFDIYVSGKDKRFDYKLKSLNQDSVKFVVVEGDIFEKVVRKFFPKAKVVVLPQLTPESDVFLYVSTGKADAAISTPLIAAAYIKNNADKIRAVVLERPFIFANVGISLKADEYRLRRMLDLATLEMQGNGQLAAIIDKHDQFGVLGHRILPFERKSDEFDRHANR